MTHAKSGPDLLKTVAVYREQRNRLTDISVIYNSMANRRAPRMEVPPVEDLWTVKIHSQNVTRCRSCDIFECSSKPKGKRVNKYEAETTKRQLLQCLLCDV